MQPYEKVRGKTRAIERLVQIVTEKVGTQKVKCSLVHGMNPTALEQLAKKLTPMLNCDELIFSTLGSVVGTHVGPKVVGIVFIAE